MILRHASVLYQQSLPSRECGLKWKDCGNIRKVQWSLPSRECGLKLVKEPETGQVERSLPSRECGLKLSNTSLSPNFSVVTPFAGVWIEIGYRNYREILEMGHSLRGSVD